MHYLDDGPQDRELGRFSARLVRLQDLLDELLDLSLRHAVPVPGLPQDVDALRELVVDAGFAQRSAHGEGDEGNRTTRTHVSARTRQRRVSHDYELN